MNDTIEEQLIKATLRGDIEKVNALLLNPELDINYRVPEHGFSTAMELAVKEGVTDVALRILEHPNYDIASTDLSGGTILHHATDDLQYGAETTKILLDAEADALINVQNCRGETALHLACVRGNPLVVRELLTVSGIQLSIANNNGETPLMIAMNYRYLHRINTPDICNLLLDSNASCNEPAETLSVGSPLRTAIRFGMNSMVTRLLEEGAATTFQVSLDLLLENNEIAVMETTLFESENLATYALNICQDPNVPFDSSISIADKVVTACPFPPHDEAVFQLYTECINKTKRGLMKYFIHSEAIRMADTPEMFKQLFSVLYKSFGPSVEEIKLKYLMTKYQLSVEDDSKLIVPFTTKPLRLLGILKSREFIVENTGSRNVVKALSVWRELTEEFEDLQSELDLKWSADHFLTKMGV